MPGPTDQVRGLKAHDAAIVQYDDLDREFVADEGLHLHAGEADRRVAGEVNDRPVGLGDGGGDRLAEADPHRAVGAGAEAGTGVGDIQSGGSPVM